MSMNPHINSYTLIVFVSLYSILWEKKTTEKERLTLVRIFRTKSAKLMKWISKLLKKRRKTMRTQLVNNWP